MASNKLAKWLFEHSQCNGSAVVSPLPIYHDNSRRHSRRHRRSSSTSSSSTLSRGAEKIMGLLGPETQDQQRQIEDLLECNNTSDRDESDLDSDSDTEATQSRTDRFNRVNAPPRLTVPSRLSKDSESNQRQDSFRFQTTTEKVEVEQCVRPGFRQSDDSMPSSRPVYYSKALNYHVRRNSNICLYNYSPKTEFRQEAFYTPVCSPRQLSPRGEQGDSRFSTCRSPGNIFGLPEYQFPSPFMSPRQPSSPFLSPQQSPYHSVCPSPRQPSSPFLSPQQSPYHSVCPSPVHGKSEVVLYEKIGSGSYASVHKGLYVQSGAVIAVKVLHDDDKLQTKEVSLLSRLHHKHIVKYLGTTTLMDGRSCILLELMKYSLESLIKKLGRLDERRIRIYTRQILLGLEYLHREKIVHRDIKCGNILLDANGTAKLGDFGVSKKIDYSMAKSCKGTLYYMAPEVLLTSGGQQYGLAADIWSLGCTVIEMADGKPPWSGFGMMPFYERMREGHIPPIPKGLSKEAVSFIKTCLTREPRLRPKASDLLKHPFLCKTPGAANPSNVFDNRMLYRVNYL